MPGVFFLVVGVAVVFLTLADLGCVLVGVQPAFQQLGTALLAGRRVPLLLLLAQRVKFLLEGIVTRPGRIMGVSHGGVLLVFRRAGRSFHEIAARAAWPARVRRYIGGR
jgi:hypothetical protein